MRSILLPTPEAELQKGRRRGRDGVVWKAQSTKAWKEAFGENYWMQQKKSWSAQDDTKLRGVRKTPRVLDLIDFKHAEAVQGGKDMRFQALEIAESHEWALKYSTCFDIRTGLAPCVSSKVEIYLFGEDRVLTTTEYANMMGFSTAATKLDLAKGLRAVGNKDGKDLLANSMAVPHIAAVVSAAALILPDVYKRRGAWLPMNVVDPHLAQG